MIAPFKYSSPYIFFDGPAYTISSLGCIVHHLVRELRKKNIPAFSSAPAKSHKDPEFYYSRHLSRDLPSIDRTRIDDYIYVNPGWDMNEDLVPHARQAVSIMAIDDYRAYSRRNSSRRYDKIVTFSTHGAKALAKILGREVSYFPLGVDSNTFFPISAPSLPPLDFLYKNFSFPLSSFRGYVFFNINFHQKRKGTTSLLSSYWKAFQGNPNVLLLIHGPQCAWADSRETKLLSSFNSLQAPLIAWSKNQLTAPQVNQLYNFSSCYVSPHHLEGFGFGPLQALACEKAVIASDASGPRDYLNSTNSVLIPCKETWKQIENYGKFPWAEYKEDDLIDLLRSFPNPTHTHTPKLWSWERSARVFSPLLGKKGVIEDSSSFSESCTIVIICKDLPGYLAKCLASIEKFNPGYPYKILVVNDGANPEIARMLRANTKITVLSTEKSFGTSHARNVALKEIRTKYTLFLDADTEVLEAHWLSLWINQHEAVGASISSVLHLHPDGTVNFDSNTIVGSNPNYGKCPNVSSSSCHQIPYAQGSGLLALTSLAKKFGFCEDFTYYYDDVDFSHYVVKNGGTCWFLNATRIQHLPRGAREPSQILSEEDAGSKTYSHYWV